VVAGSERVAELFAEPVVELVAAEDWSAVSCLAWEPSAAKSVRCVVW
jgi:hypothetical protein